MSQDIIHRVKVLETLSMLSCWPFRAVPFWAKSFCAQRLFALLACVLLGSVPWVSLSVVHAAPRTIGLLGIDGANAEPGMAAILTDALRRNIPRLHGMQIEPRTQDLAEVKIVFACQDEKPPCLTKIGRSMHVSRLLFGTVRRQGANLLVQLRHFNVLDGTLEKTVNDTVPSALLLRPSVKLDDLCKRWLDELLVEGLRGGLAINTNPPGALVFLDGEIVGRTPYTASSLELGQHSIKIELTGFATLVQTVHIRPNQSATLDLALLEETSKAPLSEHRPTVQRNWQPILHYAAYGFFGVSAVSIVAALGTTGAMSKAQDRANEHLDALQLDLGPAGAAYNDFFSSRARLARCEGPTDFVGRAPYDAYVAECRSGNRLASASTALWITGGAFATLGAVSLLTAYFLKPDAEKNATGVTKNAHRLRLEPLVSPSAVAVSAAMTF
jgi:hypothetical protein